MAEPNLAGQIESHANVRTLIIADDLTGALDTGVAFGKHGIATSVIVDADSGSMTAGNDPDCTVLVLNVNCRHDLPAAAYRKVSTVLHMYKTKAESVYIKTDSALRGNLSAMFQAALDAIPQPLMFIPAFPHVGRTTVDGIQLIDGIPLERSAFRNDPLNPMTQSYIPDILQADYEPPVQVVGINELHQITPNTVEQGSVYVFDCMDDLHLGHIVDHLANQGLLHLIAGCAAFASALSDRSTGWPAAKNDPLSFGLAGHLIVSGSANPRTFAQLADAVDHGIPVQVIPPSSLLSGDDVNPACIGGWERQVLGLLQHGQTTIIATAATLEDLAACRREAASLGLTDVQMHHRIAKSMTRLTLLTLQAAGPLLLTIFGGDTAQDLLYAIHNPVLSVIDEIEPGVPVSTMTFEPGICALITKSGGLGSPAVIHHIEVYFGRKTT